MKPIDKLEKYVRSVDFPQKGAILDLVGQIRDADNRRTRVLGLVQEAISQLRLDFKYLTFDLEATRRERDEALGK
jgi:hypothetical protein